MKFRNVFFVALFLIVALVFLAQAQEKGDKKAVKEKIVNLIEQKTVDVFKQHCAVAGCHRGAYPKKKLNLEPEKFRDALLDVPSRQVPSLMLVDTKNPEKSYLLVKMKGSKGIVDAKMPVDSPPLTAEEIKAVEDWVMSFAPKAEKKKETESSAKKKTMN